MISVVIPSYNSESTIEKCLNALLTQTYTGPYEIILADSSQDRTRQIVKDKFPQVRIVSFETKTDPGTARNAAVRQSTGELLLLIDSDCVAAPDWMERMVLRHQQSNYAAIGGGIINGNDPNNSIAWAGYMAEFREFLPETEAGVVPHVPTCNISYKRKIFDELGGFDPEFYPQEDLEFNFRLTQAGYKIYFDPDIQIWHTHRESMTEFVDHQQKIGGITAVVLQQLPLQGSKIARSRLLSVLLAPFVLPVIKWLRTLLVFFRKRPDVIFRQPKAVLILARGLIAWGQGFKKGAFYSHP